MQKKVFAVLVALLCLGSTLAMAEAPLKLTLFHINDTHANLKPVLTEFKVDVSPTLTQRRTFVELGGFARLWTAVDQLAAIRPNNLLVSAGDVFQGTLYFNKFQGDADLAFLEGMGMDAMALGNHEFDKGPVLLADFAAKADFPLLACNLDLSAEPALAAAIKPFVVKEIAGAKVALIGVANPETPYISSPGPNVKFLDPADSVKAAIAKLTAQGVNKIIVVSHLGYDLDLALAAKVDGIDVIVGGHSHSLTGPVANLGLAPKGDYPTLAKSPSGATTLVVTAWQWGAQLGVLDLEFDAAGKVTSYQGMPKFVAGVTKLRIYDLLAADGTTKKRVEFNRAADGSIAMKEYDGAAYTIDAPAANQPGYLASLASLAAKYQNDSRFIFVQDHPTGASLLEKFSAPLAALEAQIASVAGEELKRGNNTGLGPTIADSMTAKTGASIAILNPGGVRVDMVAGNISVGGIYRLLPFGNTLVNIKMNGKEIVAALEDMADFSITTYGKAEATAYVYVSGVKFALNVNAAKGARVKDVWVKVMPGIWHLLTDADTYTVTVNNFMAAGGDKNNTLMAIPAARKVDTGFIDAEAMLEFVTGKTLMNQGAIRVKNVM
jgi:5'-nucleotidase